MCDDRDTRKTERERLITSQIRLRRLIGLLGIGLPYLLIVASILCGDSAPVKATISHYYDCRLPRDVFVGIICAIGAFLSAYKGYGPADDRASLIAGMSAFGVVFFPLNSPDLGGAIRLLHILSALVLFLTLAYISRCRFTKTDCESIPKGSHKAMRNMVYTLCAYMMITCIVAIVAFHLPGFFAGRFSLHLVTCRNEMMCCLFPVGLILLLVLFLYWASLRWKCFTEGPRRKQLYEDCRLLLPMCLVGVGIGASARYSCGLSSTFVFWGETVLLMAFGVSWLVKGETLMRDNNGTIPGSLNDENVSVKQ